MGSSSGRRAANVTVRWCRVDGVSVERAAAVGALSHAELTRVARFRAESDRRLFVGARLLLRTTVAETTGCAPALIRLHQRCERCGGPHGRPIVRIDGATGPSVSMAHSGDVAIVAVASRQVGVDIERRLRPLPDALPDGIDLTTWVRTEAVLKASGHGLTVDPRLVRLSPADAPPQLLDWSGPGHRPSLRLADLTTEPGYVAGLARFGRRRLSIDAQRASLDLADH